MNVNYISEYRLYKYKLNKYSKENTQKYSFKDQLNLLQKIQSYNKRRNISLTNLRAKFFKEGVYKIANFW